VKYAKKIFIDQGTMQVRCFFDTFLMIGPYKLDIQYFSIYQRGVKMKGKRYLLCGFFAMLAFIACSVTVYGGGKDDDKTLAPYFFVEGKDMSVDNFPLKETDVTANIAGVIADVYVVQTYVNVNPQKNYTCIVLAYRE